MTDVAVRDERTPAEILIAQVRSDLFQQQVALALPGPGGPERFVRAAVTLLQSNPEIAEKADGASVAQSLIRCAQDGLLPDGREAAIVPYKGKAQYLRMIAGVRRLAAEFGWSLRTAVVYEHDEFEFERGLQPRLTHRPARPGVDRGRMIAAYAIANKPGVATEFEVMYEPDIDKARASSRSKDRGPWVDWPERMWEKTVGHALFKQLPLGDLDLERERRLRDDTYGQDPAATLYGAHPVVDARVVGELGPGEQPPTDTDTPASPADGGSEPPTEAAAAGQQAEGGTRAAGAAPAPDSPEPDPTGGSDVPVDVGEFVVPSGSCAGHTLAQVHAMPEGPKWLEWAAAGPDSLDDLTVAAVREFLAEQTAEAAA